MHTTRLRRALAVAATVGSLLIGSALVAPSASAADLDGAVLDTTVGLCQASSLSAQTNMTVRSPGAQPQTGQDFLLIVTVVGLNRCATAQAASINLLLPFGVTMSPTGQPACVRFAASNPAGAVSRPCVRTPVDNGFVRFDPQGLSSWPIPRTGRNVAQVQVPVRVSTPGSFTAFARVCDFGATVDCGGSPVANVIPSVAFTVAGPFTADQLGIAHIAALCRQNCNGDYNLAITPTSIVVRAAVSGPRPPGILRIERRVPGAAQFKTVASTPLPSGSDFRMLHENATGLQPTTMYQFRSCYRPTGAADVCTATIQLRTDPA